MDENGNVTIRYKDYKGKIRTTETMTGEEFVRRFMLHNVPNGVHRVRYGGIFHGKGRTARLDAMPQTAMQDTRNVIAWFSRGKEIWEGFQPLRLFVASKWI